MTSRDSPFPAQNLISRWWWGCLFLWFLPPAPQLPAMQQQGAGATPSSRLPPGTHQCSPAQKGLKRCGAFPGYPPSWQEVPLPSTLCFVRWRCQLGSGRMLQTHARESERCNVLLPTEKGQRFPGAPNIWKLGAANWIPHCPRPSRETVASFAHRAVQRVALLQQRSWAWALTVAAVPTTLPEMSEGTWCLMHCEKGELVAKADKQALDYCFLSSLCTWILCITGQVI